jgi:2'-5' RNA ligase
MPSRRSIANEEDWGEQPALFDTSVEIFRYLVVISPSQQMIGDVARLKANVAQAIGPFRSEKAIAHITLLYAYLPIHYERDIMAAITRAVADHQPFEVLFNGIGHFPDKTSVFIDPVEKAPIIAVRKSIRRSIQGNPALKRLGIHATSQPMITMARHLEPEQFHLAWQALAPHQYHQNEQIDQVILLRGGQREGEKYQQVGTFMLKASPTQDRINQ